MRGCAVRCVACLLAVAPLRAVDGEAAALLAKSVAAFQSNLEHEKHWNWTTTETRQILGKSGEVLQTLPELRSESVIMNDGKRCNAVTFWGDGHQPYLKDAPPEDRCVAYSGLGTPFNVALLLKSANVKIAARDADSVTIAVAPDKARQKDPDYGVRCAASIAGTIRLDAKTSFPLRVEGTVVDSGCDAEFQPVMHDQPILRGPVSANFRKTAAFHVVWALQKDRFGNSENSYWITTEQHYDQPIHSDISVVYYWGRQFRVRTKDGKRLVKEVVTGAKEFGAGSQVTFK
jgi:hypothetical protein